MPQIRFHLDPSKMTNPDLNIRYVLPDLLSTISDSTLVDDGFDYTDDNSTILSVFMISEDLEADLEIALRFLSSNPILGNNLLDTVEIFTSEEGQIWKQRYPAR